MLPDVPNLVSTLDRFEGDEPTRIEGFLDAFRRAEKKSYEQGHVLMTMACAAAYSPDDDSPVGFVLPFDPHTGAIRPDVWDRWLSFDPVRMVDRHADALRRARLLFIDCGTRDQYGLLLGARQLHAKLEDLNVAHVYEEFEDNHSGLQYRWDRSIPLLVDALQSSELEQGAVT